MMELDRSKQAEVEPVKKTPEPPTEPDLPPTEPEPESEPTPAPESEPPAEPQPSEVVHTAAPKRRPVNLDDATDRVVDEIVISEGDALLAAEDLAAQLKTVATKPKSKSIFGRLFSK
jgi:hypothetical protein